MEFGRPLKLVCRCGWSTFRVSLLAINCRSKTTPSACRLDCAHGLIECLLNSMEISENLLNSLKLNGDHWKSMKIYRILLNINQNILNYLKLNLNQWKSMKIYWIIMKLIGNLPCFFEIYWNQWKWKFKSPIEHCVKKTCLGKMFLGKSLNTYWILWKSLNIYRFLWHWMEIVENQWTSIEFCWTSLNIH